MTIRKLLIGNKFATLFTVLLISLASMLTINSCRKMDTAGSKPGEEFNVAAAKEWWYGKFKKSDEYYSLDHNSLFINSLNLGLNVNKKYPSWKRGINYTVGGLEIVELPLYYNNPVTIFPGSDLLSKEDKIRIAKASINKLLIIEKQDKNISVRTVTLIPSLDYARSRNYDISNNTLKTPDKAFTGWMVIKDWKQTLIGYWQIENGRRIRRMIIEKKDQTISHRIEQEVCEYVLVEETANICVGDLIEGDEPGDPPECTEWYIQTTFDYQWICYEVGGVGDPMGDCLSMGNFSDECICQVYGLGCGNPDPDPDPDPNYASPCDEANRLEDHVQFRNLLTELKGHTSGNTENSRLLTTTSPANFTSTNQEGNAGEHFMNIAIQAGTEIDGILHNHFQGGLSIFSPDDIYAMCLAFTNGHINNTQTFALGLITASNTQYLLLIDDLIKFQQFATAIIGNGIDAYSNAFAAFGVLPGNSNSQNEKNFLNYIQKLESGLKLFRGNDTFTEWKPKKYENQFVVNAPCN